MPHYILFSAIILLTMMGIFPIHVYANQPVIEGRTAPGSVLLTSTELYATNQPLGDPSVTGVTLYGQLTASGEIDVYSFMPTQDDTIPIEIVVPAKNKYGNFRPSLVVIGQNLPPQDYTDIPVAVPLGYDQYVLPSPVGKRTAYFDIRGLQLIFSGSTTTIPVTAQTPYFLFIYDPREFTGEYRIRVGSRSNFSTSYQSHITIPDLQRIVFPDSGVIRSPQDAPLQPFVEHTNPFELFDNQVKLIGDIAGYIMYRLSTLF